MDFEIIIQECFLGDPPPKFLKDSATLNKMATRAIKRNKLLTTSSLNRWTDFEIFSQEGSLGDCLPNCSKPSAPLNKMAPRAKNRKTFK